MEKVLEQISSWEGYLEKRKRDYSLYELFTSGAGYNSYNRFSRICDKLFGYKENTKDGYHWCACAIVASFYEAIAGRIDTSVPNGGLPAVDTNSLNEVKRLLCVDHSYGWEYYAGVDAIGKAYKKANQWIDSKSRIGDLIIFRSTLSENEYKHIGFVYKVDEKFVYTIEGNTSDVNVVEANGGGMFKKKYPLASKEINGYCRPAYKE